MSLGPLLTKAGDVVGQPLVLTQDLESVPSSHMQVGDYVDFVERGETVHDFFLSLLILPNTTLSESVDLRLPACMITKNRKRARLPQAPRFRKVGQPIGASQSTPQGRVLVIFSRRVLSRRSHR